MTDFLRNVLDAARQHHTEEHRKKTERDSERLARWHRFKNNYESMALAIQSLDGLLTVEQRKTDKHDKVQGVIRVETEFVASGQSKQTTDMLPVEPPWDRHFVVRLLIEAPGRPTIGYAAWLTQWKYEPQPENRYHLSDKCWFDFHSAETVTAAFAQQKLIERLRSRIDMSAYEEGSPTPRNLDL